MPLATDEEFDDFVAAVSPTLLRTAYLLTGDRGHAEDLLQDALERTYRRWRRRDGLRAPEAYLRRTVTNLAINRWRGRSRRREVDFAAVSYQVTVGDAFGPVELRAVLWPALLSLPARQRAVLVLRHWEDLSEADTAEVLGCSVGTVKSQAHHGLATLREALRGTAIHLGHTLGERSHA